MEAPAIGKLQLRRRLSRKLFKEDGGINSHVVHKKRASNLNSMKWSTCDQQKRGEAVSWGIVARKK